MSRCSDIRLNYHKHEIRQNSPHIKLMNNTFYMSGLAIDNRRNKCLWLKRIVQVFFCN